MTKTLTRAGPAEILRAAQKDDYYCEKLRNTFCEILLQVGGTKFLIKYRDYVSTSSDLLYYSATTLSGLQTLGEEYTGIIQYDSSHSIVPTLKKRLLMILLSSFGQKLITLLLLKLEQSKCLQDERSEIRPKARVLLLNVLAYIKIVAPFMERLHRAVFYWTGYYCHLSKRMTGIQYVLIRYWLKNRESLYGFKLLSIITVLQTVLSGASKSINFIDSLKNEENVTLLKSSHNKTSKQILLQQKKCSLCLDERKNVSMTPCGHLFCWYCILEWVQVEQKCPVCRETVLPSRVVPLQHYS